MAKKISVIDSPGLSDNDRYHLRDGLVERVTGIVHEQVGQLIERMTVLGMAAQYKVEPRLDHVELTLMVKRADAQKIIISRIFSVEIYATGRSYAVGAVRYVLEGVIQMLFFEKEDLN